MEPVGLSYNREVLGSNLVSGTVYFLPDPFPIHQLFYHSTLHSPNTDNVVKQTAQNVTN
jgi:hypothetical protein